MTKGERIRELRRKKGMSQSDLAKALNTTKQTISKYEKSIVTNIPSDKIEAMSILFNTSPEYILGWEEKQKKNDIAVDIILKMQDDENFMSMVEMLYNLDSQKQSGIKQLLVSLSE